MSVKRLVQEIYIADLFKISPNWKQYKYPYIDKYINKGKRGGAYSWGGYDTKPYVLLNYNYELM